MRPTGRTRWRRTAPGRPLDENDIAEMKVAVSAADQAAPAALQRGADECARGRRGSPCVSASTLGWREKRGHLAGTRRRSARYSRASAAIQGSASTARAPACAAATARPSASASAASIRPASARPVERRLLVEAAHLDRPFDRRAGAVEREPAVRRARDRHHAQIDLGRERPVDLELGLAGALALIEGRIIQEREAHGTLDLERAVPARNTEAAWVSMRSTGCSAMGRGVGEQREDRLLGLAVVHSRCASLHREARLLIIRRGY